MGVIFGGVEVESTADYSDASNRRLGVRLEDGKLVRPKRVGVRFDGMRVANGEVLQPARATAFRLYPVWLAWLLWFLRIKPDAKNQASLIVCNGYAICDEAHPVGIQMNAMPWDIDY